MAEVTPGQSSFAKGSALFSKGTKSYAYETPGYNPLYEVKQDYLIGFSTGEQTESLGRQWVKCYSIIAFYQYVWVPVVDVFVADIKGVTREEVTQQLNNLVSYDMATMSKLVVLANYIDVIEKKKINVSTYKYREIVKEMYNNIVMRQQKIANLPNIQYETGYNKQLENQADPLYKILHDTQIGAPQLVAILVVIVIVVIVGAAGYALIKYTSLPDNAESIADFNLTNEAVEELKKYVPDSALPGVIEKIEKEAKKYGQQAYKDGYTKSTFNAFGGVVKYVAAIVGGGLLVKYFMDNYTKK
jgi:hypothetical protein